MNRVARRAFAVTVTGGVAFMAIGTPRLANAQVVSSFRELAGSVKDGEQLTITEQAGTITKGRLVALSDQSLRLVAESGRPLDLGEGSVAKIDRHRSRVGKSALIGFVAGFVGGALAVALTPESDGIGPSKGSVILPLAAIFGGIGAGVGAGVGAARPERRLIYLASGIKANVP